MATAKGNYSKVARMVGLGTRRAYTPEQVRELLDLAATAGIEAHALAMAELSPDERCVVTRYVEQVARKHERLADEAERRGALRRVAPEG
jgi:hypothetical protein